MTEAQAAPAPRTACVVTTIFAPGPVLRALAAGCAANGWHFAVAGDAKSPHDFGLEGCDWWPLARQGASGFAYARLCPTGHYARKNVGYLAAVAAGAERIVETDDDNIPEPDFFAPLPEQTPARLATGKGWHNVYRHFLPPAGPGEPPPAWPRGLPLEMVGEPAGPLGPEPHLVHAPIQQGLADDNPDVDAVFRLTRPLPLRFAPDAGPVALGRGQWCPFNSQNTVFYRQAFPLLYLPAHCSFRMTDIWRGLVAQRIGWECGWQLLFRAPTVRQERNAHDLTRDFAEELPGYLHNARIAAALEALPLSGGADAIPDNLRACYRLLVEMELVGAGELVLLDAWLGDLADLAG